jgi:hypothetical protein
VDRSATAKKFEFPKPVSPSFCHHQITAELLLYLTPPRRRCFAAAKYLENDSTTPFIRFVNHVFTKKLCKTKFQNNIFISGAYG